MEVLLERQAHIATTVERIITNFKKDSANRKTADYLKTRVETLENLWSEYESNHTLLQQEEDTRHDYFTSNAYDSFKLYYGTAYQLLKKASPYTKSTGDGEGDNPEQTPELRQLLGQQQTNFRALQRMLKNIKVNSLLEKWEIEDKLQTLQVRWRTVDELHWRLDNLLQGSDEEYEAEFTALELRYEVMKTSLNRKLNSVKHQQESTPHIEIPTFSGSYANWPTFADLYCEAIHNNPTLNKTQKMQHLKGKLKGEAERIVQHLKISADNYDTCWSILERRYNNIQLSFTTQMQTFMNQSSMQKHTAYEIKRLHDISMETVHAIHNLGVDTSTWDPILVHIMTEKMDPETYTAYMDARTNKRELPSFEELITFLEAKFTALEPLNKKGKSNKVNSHSTKENEPKQKDVAGETRHKFAKTYNTYTTGRGCPLCKNNNHVLLQCRKFLNMTPDVKLTTIKTLSVCINCLFIHKGSDCNPNKKCKVCNNAHHTILHEAISDTEPQPSTSNQQTATSSPRKANHVAGSYDEILLATVEIKVRSRDGSLLIMRCLLDQGSQINLVTESAAQRLGLERCNQNASVFGVGSSATHSNGAVKLSCESRYNNYSFVTDALVMPKVIGNLPNFTFEKQPWSHLHNINLADPEYNVSRPVDILLDAKVYAEILMDGILRGPANAPIAQQTQLGWVLVGNVKTYNCHAVLNNLDEISQYWEMEEITEQTTGNMTPAEEYCETLYRTTTTRKPDGRYEVRLPMKPCFEENLSSSKPQAVAQFKQLEKRFAKNNKLSESYKNFIAEYLELGHMKRCTAPREPSCYLPHHGVIKLDSLTTKLRTVFNASCKLKTGYSLNELMECGPNLQQDLQGMLLTWRTFQYVYTADIEKFYRQILVQEEDQHLQKIVWRDSASKQIEDYQLCTVTYGTKAAPFLSMRTIKQLIQDDGHKYPLAVTTLNNQLYVDDLLGGSNNIQQAQDVQTQLMNMLRGGGFNLRKWASNDARLLKNLSSEQISQNMLDFKHAETNKTLGLSWNPCTDQFTFARTATALTAAADDKKEVTTKRSLLSDISKIFDPLGWLSPVTIKGKLIFQKLWTLPLAWDDEIPQDIQLEWGALQQDLHNISNISLPRWIGNTERTIELHGFSDASEKAFGCAIYCKSIDNNKQPLVKLVAAKTKLAPLNKVVSLPRLELCGALLLSRLMKKVIDSMNFQTRLETIHGWTDSMVVLGWLRGDISRWKTFVANRVSSILDIMPATCWGHVKSEENAADCASRGLLPSQLQLHTLWWEGPEWLKNNEKLPQPTTINIPSPEEEVKSKCCVANNNNQQPIVESLLERSSSMGRATRILAWVSRFIYNLRSENNKLTSKLSVNEIRNAHNIIIKATQQQHFALDIAQLSSKNKLHRKSQLLNLNPFLDADGLLRVGGRLGQSGLSNQSKHPVIVPHNDKISTLLISWAHAFTLHGGARLTLTYLRTKYWMLGGMSAVKRELAKCVKCLRFKASSKNQLMADLPKPRVTPSRPFTHTGVDFAGPVDVKSNRGRGIATTKGYIAIFICLSTKAIHIELVSDLSSITFLAAFKRLCARRGTPKHMYSDCGTNFIGAAKSLTREHQQALEHYLTASEVMDHLIVNGVEWHFNAPSWPTAGGLWEAAVKRMKYHLKRVLGAQKLTFEEFTTLLSQIEACLNSRPLVSLTNSIEDLDCLTPGHFLIGDQTLAPPLLHETENISLGTRWKLTEKMHKDFWNKWSMEYLQTLQTRSKWHYVGKDFQVGDMVIIKEDNVPPARWLLGRVTQTHPGSDGRIRVVSLKTKNKDDVKRPVSKLIRLPVESESSSPQQSPVPEPNNPETKDNSPPHQTHQRGRRQTTAKRRTINKYINLANILFLLLGMFTSTVTTQQAGDFMKVTLLDPNKPLYFDKVANMQVIQDEWKMVVFYNMSTYWNSLANIEAYVNILDDLTKDEPVFKTITYQLRHEVNELKHYNNMLRVEHGRRTKRGLINGVGYVANTLFGVLDERFANKYDKDIKTIQANENHLIKLYKQQTSIIEGEYNILRRNEELMLRQFADIGKQIANLNVIIQSEHKRSMYITAAALASNLIITNLRQVQQQLLDLVTDIRSGRMDSHLLEPEEFKNQLNIITAQIPNEISLPCVSNQQDCVREMYKLARVHVRLTEDFLIFEVKLPLVNNEPFELNHVIPLPRINNRIATYIRPSAKYLALNLKKDMIIPITEEDIHTGCITFKESKLLCRHNMPIHTTTNGLSTLCEAQIINNNNMTGCGTAISSCRNEWIMLHSRAAWLFSCCQECATRLFCSDAAVTSTTLHGVGIAKIWPNCMLKGDNIIIHSTNTYHTEVTINGAEAYLPESEANNFVEAVNFTYIPEPHEQQFNALRSQIDNMKATQDKLDSLSISHDAHHYIVYGIIALVATIAGGYWVIRRKRKRSDEHEEHDGSPDIELQSVRHTEEPQAAVRSVATCTRQPVRLVNKQTSP